jgi:adenine-specific DNA-methyltransferase
MQNLLEELKKLLEQDERLVVEGKLLKNKIIESALKLDVDLIRLLLKSETIKTHFFQEVDGILVFDKIKFQKFVSNKAFLPDSYTSFKNKIGLVTENEEYLSESKEVVLAWPYKDCVLEGGQEKEDEKRNEIFYNEILAPDEIDRLLEPKVLTNFKRIDKDGEYKVRELKENDNLIIRGNNLLALHSLKKRFAGRIKLIYIDPPYNRGNERDDFLYNDSFKHSTWLTFIKNRLKIAKEILMPNEGFIWISISDNEGHYLKALCDEIFDRENFIADVIWNSTKSVTNTAVISDAHTHNLLYVRNIEWLKKNRTKFRLPADESKFSNPNNDPRGKWIADPFQVGGIRPNQRYSITNPKTGEVYNPLPGNSWKNEKEVFDRLMAEGRIVFGVSGESGPQRKRFWSDAKERGEVTTTLWCDLPTTTSATKHLKELFKNKVFENPKPEGLIKRIIELSTDEGDIVLDFFAGSGTTAATALKMKRQFITFEQMSYIEDVTVERLKKTIKGEQGGISKGVNWQGGGDFIYCELMKLNEKYIDEIKKVETTKELIDIWKTMKEKAFLSYKVDIKKFDLPAATSTTQAGESVKEFEQLNIENQKKFLIECLDKNQLYVNLSEIDDTEYEISKEDKELNKQFYEVK